MLTTFSNVSRLAVIREMNPAELQEEADRLYDKETSSGLTIDEFRCLKACEENYFQVTGNNLWPSLPF